MCKCKRSFVQFAKHSRVPVAAPDVGLTPATGIWLVTDEPLTETV